MEVLTTPDDDACVVARASRATGASASCRRWARSTPATCRWSTSPPTRGDDVVVSIFVNPLQFDRAADFDAYPRPIDDDVDGCRAAGVDAVYAPTAAAMYPAGFETHVEPGALGRRDGGRGPARATSAA